MNEYGNRIIDEQLNELLRIFGAVVIEGSKGCGKTWAARNASNSEIMIADPDNAFAVRELAQRDPAPLLEGEYPRMIDEWQEAPSIWDAVRYKVDAIGKKGLYILTGSSVPPIGKTIHSGTGRIARLQMRPMTLSEFGDSSKEISFRELVMTDLQPRGENPLNLEKIIDICIRGGWPGALNLPYEEALQIPKQYIQSIANSDISRYDDVDRNSLQTKRLLRSLARNEQTLVSNKTLLADVGNISENTLMSYKNVLEKLFVLENIPPFSPNIRSKSRLRVAEKTRFVDPSLAIAALRLTKEKLLYDLNTFGFMFESMCTRDILSYCIPFRAEVTHYREASNGKNNPNEVDIVLELDNEEYALVEIKLGATQIADAEKSLLHISQKLVSKGAEPPKSMIIICGTVPFAHTLPSGIKVVPIGCLKE
jgi:predicted AAA+ superfamily ATPase